MEAFIANFILGIVCFIQCLQIKRLQDSHQQLEEMCLFFNDCIEQLEINDELFDEAIEEQKNTIKLIFEYSKNNSEAINIIMKMLGGKR